MIFDVVAKIFYLSPAVDIVSMIALWLNRNKMSGGTSINTPTAQPAPARVIPAEVI